MSADNRAGRQRPVVPWVGVNPVTGKVGVLYHRDGKQRLLTATCSSSS